MGVAKFPQKAQFWFEKAAVLGCINLCYVAKDSFPKEILTTDSSPEEIVKSSRIGLRMRCLVLKQMERRFTFMWSFILPYPQPNFEKMLILKEKKSTNWFAWIPCVHVACECKKKMNKCESCKVKTKSFIRHVCFSKNKKQKICLESLYKRILKIKQGNNLVERLHEVAFWFHPNGVI